MGRTRRFITENHGTFGGLSSQLRLLEAEILPDTVAALYDRDLRCLQLEGPMLLGPEEDPQDYVGLPLQETVTPDHATYLQPLVARALSGKGGSIEYRTQTTGRGFRLEVLPFRGPHGDVQAALAVWRDITGQMLQEREVRRLATIVEHSDDAIIGESADGSITSWNDGAERLFGYSALDAIGQPLSLIVPRGYKTRERGLLAQVLRGEQVARYDAPRVRKDGVLIDVQMSLSPIRDEHGRVVGAAAIASDITELKLNESARRHAEERFRIAFENAPIGVAITGAFGAERGVLLQANAAFTRMLGYEPGQLDKVALEQVVHPDDRQRTKDALSGTAVTPTHFEARYLHREGRPIWVHVSTSPVGGGAGAATYFISQVLDISERKRFEEQLRHLADHDALTGLCNRTRFESEFRHVIRNVQRYRRRAALLMIDLDGFKLINDTFGHAVGDELLVRVAGLLENAVRETDIVARLGGDEFAVVVQECDPEGLEIVASKLLAAIREGGTVTVGDRSARVTGSVGVTVLAGDCDLTVAELLIEADIAMYDAKSEGRDRFCLYDRTANRREQVSRRHSWLELLRDAIQGDGFELYAQPIVGIAHDEGQFHELLLRLRGHEGELISPGTFLYYADRFDLMGDIDRWVLRQAVLLLHDQHAAGQEVNLSVNVSAKTMNDLELPSYLASLLEDSPIPPGRLTIEVTETAAIVNMERARELGGQLRDLGCRFALDDFGAGFASFYYLKHLDFDYLKIDGEFIRTLSSNPRDRLVVKAVVDIAHGLKTRTIAECVGDRETAALLEQLGVDFGQGYYLGVPGPVAERLTAAA